MKALFSILFLIELTWLVVDALSGYLMFSGVSVLGPLSLGAAFRILVVALLLVIAMGQRRSDALLALGLVVFSVVFAFWHVVGGRTDVDMLQNTFKLILAPLFYIAVRAQVAAGCLDRDRLLLICHANAAVLLANLYLTFFRVGFAQYGVSEDGVFRGGSGFFFAGNEVGGALLALFTLFLALFLSGRLSGYLFWIALFFAGAVSMLSRTALAGSMIIVGFSLLVSRPKLAWTVVGTLSLGLVSLFPLYWPYIEFAINRWSYFSGQYGMSTFLLGGAKRLSFISAYLESIAREPVTLFFGSGWIGYTENNVFDLLEAYGVWGLLFYLLWFTWIANMWLRGRGGIYARETLVGVAGMLIILLVSGFAGHILQSAMMAPFVALLVCLPYILDSQPPPVSEHKIQKAVLARTENPSAGSPIG